MNYTNEDKIIEKYSWIPTACLVIFAVYLFIKVNF